MRIGSETIDLRLTLIDSAQCFRWVESNGRFGCCMERGPVWLRAVPEGIDAEGEFDPAALRHYLDLDRDYAAGAAEYARIPRARCAAGLFPGLRVLNQPPWEALVCFILSANNNVGRIRALTGLDPENEETRFLLQFGFRLCDEPGAGSDDWQK